MFFCKDFQFIMETRIGFAISTAQQQAKNIFRLHTYKTVNYNTVMKNNVYYVFKCDVQNKISQFGRKKTVSNRQNDWLNNDFASEIIRIKYLNLIKISKIIK